MSLRARLGRSAVATVPIAVAFVGLAAVEVSYFPGRDSRLHVSALREKAVALAELTANSVVPALEFEDDKVLAEFLNAVARDADVARVTACAGDGKVLYSTGAGEGGVPCPAVRATSVEVDDYALRVASPIPAKTHRGTLLIAFKTDAIARARNEAQRVAVAIALGILLLGLGVSWWIARMLLRLQTLVEENRSARTRAEAANEAKSAFLANVSHEIRTPMNGVIGVTQLLERTELNEQQRRYVRTVARSGELLLAVINDVLDFSKVEAGKLTITRAAFDVRELVTDVCDLVQANAQSKGLTLEQSVAINVPRRVQGDESRLRQVLLNLLSNAVKFTDVGRVGIRLSGTSKPASDLLRFEVSDTGIGIDGAHHATLFDAFTQVNEQSTRRHGGTGLGLAICKRLVTLMNGTIGVQSELGAGSTFWFELPLPGADEPHAAPELAVAATASAPSSRHRLLAVDDNEINRGVLEDLAQTLGYQIDLVDGGRAAVERVTSGCSYALVLMDCQMPDVDGYTATQQIRAWEQQQPRGPRIPIVAVTAHALDTERQKVLDAGMDDFLPKPVRLADLRKMLETWLVASNVGRP